MDAVCYLRRPKNLVEMMMKKRPNIAEKRCLSTGRVATSFVQNRIDVSQHLQENSAPCKPTRVYWFIIMALAVRVVEGSRGSLGSPFEPSNAIWQGVKGSVCAMREGI